MLHPPAFYAIAPHILPLMCSEVLNGKKPLLTGYVVAGQNGYRHRCFPGRNCNVGVQALILPQSQASHEMESGPHPQWGGGGGGGSCQINYSMFFSLELVVSFHKGQELSREELQWAFQLMKSSVESL